MKRERSRSVEFLIKRKQKITAEPIQNNTKQSNLVKYQHQVCQCQGTFQGDYPIYILRNSNLAEKIAQNFHKKTLHGGGGLS